MRARPGGLSSAAQWASVSSSVKRGSSYLPHGVLLRTKQDDHGNDNSSNTCIHCRPAVGLLLCSALCELCFVCCTCWAHRKCHHYHNLPHTQVCPPVMDTTFQGTSCLLTRPPLKAICPLCVVGCTHPGKHPPAVHSTGVGMG